MSARSAGDLGSIPGLGISPGEGNGNPLQYSCLENSMDGVAWWATIHGVAKSQTQLSDFTLTFSSLWVTHLAGMGFDFIMIVVPLLPSCYSFFFVFGCGVSLFGSFQHPPVNDCSTATCDFGALAGGDEGTSFSSTILSWKHFLILDE